MVHVPDDILMAYVDDELSREERAWLDGELQNDPALRQRLEPFLVTRQPLQNLFQAPLHAPVPDRLIAAINAASPSGATAEGSRQPAARTKSGASSRSSWLDRWLPQGFAGQPSFGYATVLLVGLGCGWLSSAMLTSGPDDAALMRYERSGFVAAGRLKVALDQVQSGAGGLQEGTVRPVLTLRGEKNQICRQYEIVAAKGPGPKGLACRDGTGQWHVTALAGFGSEDEGFAMPASQGGSDAAVPPALAETLKGMRGFEPLSEAEEQYLLQKGWEGAPADREPGDSQ